jgi:hypothetical protein
LLKQLGKIAKIKGVAAMKPRKRRLDDLTTEGAPISLVIPFEVSAKVFAEVREIDPVGGDEQAVI